jgi:hypothetical protein
VAKNTHYQTSRRLDVRKDDDDDDDDLNKWSGWGGGGAERHANF